MCLPLLYGCTSLICMHAMRMHEEASAVGAVTHLPVSAQSAAGILNARRLVETASDHSAREVEGVPTPLAGCRPPLELLRVTLCTARREKGLMLGSE